MNILIVKLSALGDVIHALPVSAALKYRFPDCKLTWVVEPAGYELVKHNPLIDEIIIFDKQKFKTWSSFIKEYPRFKKLLQSKKFALSIDLQGLFKSAAVVFTAGAKEKIGYCDMREGANFISRPIKGSHSQGHIVERYLDTLSQLPGTNGEVYFPWQSTAEEIKECAELLRDAKGDKITKYMALAIGTNWQNKCWSPQNFAQLIDELQAEGINSVLLGFGKADEERAKIIMANTKSSPLNLVGKTTLGETAVIIKGAKAVIGGDTGNLHLTAALKTPVIMLMGPTNPERNGPYGQLEHVILAGRSCDGCWQRKCPKQLDCLSTITPSMVMEKLKNI